jgi:hypothetical protein
MAALRLPSSIWSSLGPVPVVKKKGLVKKKDALGMWDGRRREIHLELENIPAVDASTFFHEMTHVALWDSGVQNSLTLEQIESVCDALGQYLGGMLLAGCLTVRSPKSEGS